jgi:hypothetical protein
MILSLYWRLLKLGTCGPKAGTCLYGLLIYLKKGEKMSSSWVIHTQDQHGRGILECVINWLQWNSTSQRKKEGTPLHASSASSDGIGRKKSQKGMVGDGGMTASIQENVLVQFIRHPSLHRTRMSRQSRFCPDPMPVYQYLHLSVKISLFQFDCSPGSNRLPISPSI